ncbi:MAG: DUF4395 domain-containing protein [Anaerolineae bacterium]|nr:DUF4395 domain-containing protein [Anaerolineae bacterium]
MPDRIVDHSSLRTNQAFIIVLLSLGFVLDQPLLVLGVALVMLIGTIWPEVALFKRLYRHLLVPAGLLTPDLRPDNPEPHRFAQWVGGVVSLLGFLGLWFGSPVAGWGFVWVVIVLAALNLLAGWCAGCTLYYWLNRLGVPGFGYSPVEAERS